MIAGFALQLSALHFGELALVKPILAVELVFVFGYLAVAGSGRVTRRDWLAAAAMSVGIGVFLRRRGPQPQLSSRRREQPSGQARCRW